LRFLYFEGEVGGLPWLVGLRMILDVGCDMDRKEAVAGGVGCGGGGFADQLWLRVGKKKGENEFRQPQQEPEQKQEPNGP